MQIQISWLLQKPTDLDLHCLQRQSISRFSMTRVKKLFYLQKRPLNSWITVSSDNILSLTWTCFWLVWFYKDFKILHSTEAIGVHNSSHHLKRVFRTYIFSFFNIVSTHQNCLSEYPRYILGQKIKYKLPKMITRIFTLSEAMLYLLCCFYHTNTFNIILFIICSLRICMFVCLIIYKHILCLSNVTIQTYL